MSDILLIFIFTIVAIIATIVGLWKIFTKVGEEGWKSIIPFYNSYILFQIAWDVKYFYYIIMGNIVIGVLLALVESFCTKIAMIIFLCLYCIIVKLNYKLSLSFGKGIYFTIGLITLTPIFYLILGFSKNAVYRGNSSNTNTNHFQSKLNSPPSPPGNNYISSEIINDRNDPISSSRIDNDLKVDQNHKKDKNVLYDDNNVTTNKAVSSSSSQPKNNEIIHNNNDNDNISTYINKSNNSISSVSKVNSSKKDILKSTDKTHTEKMNDSSEIQNNNNNNGDNNIVININNNNNNFNDNNNDNNSYNNNNSDINDVPPSYNEVVNEIINERIMSALNSATAPPGDF